MLTLRSTASLHFAVRLRVVGKYLGQMLAAFGLLSLVPASVAFAGGHTTVAIRYLMAITMVLAMAIPCSLMPCTSRIQTNEALVITALVFIVSAGVMTVPVTGYGISFGDALFETISAVTTTGLSTLGSVEDLPSSFLFARAWMQWTGGLGIVVLALALWIEPGPTARRLAIGEERPVDILGGTRSHARRVVRVYLVLTIAGVGLLWLTGASPFDALLHTLSAVSTGGFSPYDSSLQASDSSAFRAGVMALCLAGALSFAWYYRVSTRSWRHSATDPAFIALMAACACVTLLLFASMSAHATTPFSNRLEEAFLTAVSAQTTAGFTATDVSSLSPADKLVLIASMIVGGDVGSTAGGIKIVRVLIVFKLLQITLNRVSIPSASHVTTRLAGNPLQPRQIENAVAVILGYTGTIFLSWFVFLLHGHDPIDALFEVVSATGTVGLSTGLAGPDLQPVLRAVLCVDMLMGRFETVAIIVLVFPGTWIGRRRSSR